MLSFFSPHPFLIAVDQLTILDKMVESFAVVLSKKKKRKSTKKGVFAAGVAQAEREEDNVCEMTSISTKSDRKGFTVHPCRW